MFNKQKTFIVLMAIILVVGGLFFILKTTQAQSINLWSGIEDCRDNGECTLTSAERFAINIASIILKFLGVAALVVFIYGGILWMTSAGNAQKVSDGKNAIIGAVIGIVIVLSAYVIVFNFMKILGVDEEYSLQQPKCFEKWNECPVVDSGVWDVPCKSTAVRNVQQKLTTFKCGEPIIDGCFGDQTKAALKAFQEKNTSCNRQDGKMDKTTNTVLFGDTAQPCGN
ncbi:MAG: peptidoglycan-binding domain-containing protein [Patescibacteria group bacterium]|nr:peptidoglycan-binding domain-containing protein [Patescibacteria group bacterium]MDD5121322.1 peptidoglycan-binding domain-containing protein [Patescibacteria group bacterium]MDD5221807.1 peptidoglycan-binding domain-containing protein [Patescibacteria group bacterium]MDD5395759.1 peptidoglycan-binding domain-containing protein [Patescibacteria group bacterium]